MSCSPGEQWTSSFARPIICSASSNWSAFAVWLMSPVWIRNAALSCIAATLSIAALRVARASGLAGLAKPMWLSEIWTKEKPPVPAFASPMRREDGTPPATVQTTPVPAHSMHLRVCRRSSPASSSWIIMGLLDRRKPPFKGGDSRSARFIPGRREKKMWPAFSGLVDAGQGRAHGIARDAQEPAEGRIEIVDEEYRGRDTDRAGDNGQIDDRIARREQAEDPEHHCEPRAHRQHQRPGDRVMRRLDELAAGAQRLVDLARQRLREPSPEMVGRVKFVDCGVDLNEQRAELLALDSALILEARIGARRLRLVPPAVGDRRGHVFPQDGPDRLGVRAVFPEVDVEVREVAGKGAQAGVERVERALHLREQKAQDQGGEGDKDRDDQPDMVNRLAGPMPLAEPVVQDHADAGGAEQERENDQDEEAAVRHSRKSEFCRRRFAARPGSLRSEPLTWR